MNEAKPGMLRPQIEQVGEHLLRQIETDNPLLSERSHRFDTAAIVAEFTGSERAFDIAWSALRGESEPFKSGYYDDFAETLIERHGTQGATEATELTTYMPADDGELLKPLVLTMAVEASDDEDLKVSATSEAQEILSSADPNKHTIFSHPSNLLLRLGVANNRQELIEQAVQTLTPAADKFDFMQEVAKALKNTGEVPDMRRSLVQAAVQVQTEGIAFPAAIARYGFKDILSKEEMKALLGAVHRDGKQKLHNVMDTIFERHHDGISVSNATEFWEFYQLATAYNTWVSRREVGRFTLKALTTKVKESWRKEGRPVPGSYNSAAYMAKKITRALVMNPNADDILEYGYMFDDPATKDQISELHGLWKFGVLPQVRNGRFQESKADDVAAILDLRDRLPDLSVSRIEFNAALARSGNNFALVDSATALTRDPQGLLARPIKQKGSLAERGPHLFAYKWSFFQPAATY